MSKKKEVSQTIKLETEESEDLVLRGQLSGHAGGCVSFEETPSSMSQRQQCSTNRGRCPCNEPAVRLPVRWGTGAAPLMQSLLLHGHQLIPPEVKFCCSVQF